MWTYHSSSCFFSSQSSISDLNRNQLATGRDSIQFGLFRETRANNSRYVGPVGRGNSYNGENFALIVNIYCKVHAIIVCECVVLMFQMIIAKDLIDRLYKTE